MIGNVKLLPDDINPSSEDLTAKNQLNFGKK
jgi:hypothetical protein